MSELAHTDCYNGRLVCGHARRTLPNWWKRTFAGRKGVIVSCIKNCEGSLHRWCLWQSALAAPDDVVANFRRFGGSRKVRDGISENCRGGQQKVDIFPASMIRYRWFPCAVFFETDRRSVIEALRRNCSTAYARGSAGWFSGILLLYLNFSDVSIIIYSIIYYFIIPYMIEPATAL